MTEDGVWVVIAAYNESPVLDGVLEGVLATTSHLVVVDDGSTDTSADIARKAGAHLLRHPMNLGQGAALQTGITYALRQGAQVVVTFDADGQQDPQEIPDVVDALCTGGHAIVLGSRFLGTATNLSTARRLILRVARMFTYLTTGLALSDAHNGFRAMTREFALGLDLRQNRMAHASEIIEHVAETEADFREVPVTVRYTTYSVNKGQRNRDALRVMLELLLGRISK